MTENLGKYIMWIALFLLLFIGMYLLLKKLGAA